MRGAKTAEGRAKQRAALNASNDKGMKKAAAANTKHRKAYRNVSLPELNLPPEREQ